MDTHPNIIKKLLNQNFFLDIIARRQILKQMETFSIEQSERIEDLLKQSIQKQHDLLVRVIKKNPQILNEIKSITKKAIHREQKQEEGISLKEDVMILKTLEKELNAFLK